MTSDRVLRWCARSYARLLWILRLRDNHERQAIRQVEIVEVTPPDFKYGLVALPFTFSLAPDLTIHAIYDGWWFVGRPTLEELRQDMRTLMKACRQDYHYDGPSLASVQRK